MIDGCVDYIVELEGEVFSYTKGWLNGDKLYDILDGNTNSQELPTYLSDLIKEREGRRIRVRLELID